MSVKTAFALQHYASLALFAVVFWGLGKTVVTYTVRHISEDFWLNSTIAIAIGMAIFSVALQWMAIGGLLQRSYINVIFFIGLILAIYQIYVYFFSSLPKPQGPKLSVQDRLWALPPLILLAPTAVAALHLPYKWDELMYHLPHAQQWAQTGHLQVNAWLRYPWAPYNINILYAAGLIIRGDIFTHLLHALAGWLVTLTVYRVGLLHFGRATACISALIWIQLTHKEYDSSLVDMGVSLFICMAVVTYLNWLARREDRGWLLLSGFLLGMAIGSKYQALGFLPLFFIHLILSSKDKKIIFTWLIALAIPCIYWYARNFISTGDPFNPLGGKIFGFSEWNAGDLEYQLYDLKRSANWPRWTLWPAVLAPFLRMRWSDFNFRFMVIFGLYAFVVWLLTSHYDRYLMPAYPIIAILSAGVVVFSVKKLFFIIKLDALKSPLIRIKYLNTIIIIFAFIIFSIPVEKEIKHKWAEVSLSEADGANILRHKVQGYALIEKIRGKIFPKVYQWGLENNIYYLQQPIYGDHFGPWRYRDLNDLTSAQLWRHFKSQDFSTLLVHANTVPGLETKPEFFQYFSVIAEGHGSKAYSILKIKNSNE
ncbi:ArnT family glycosyltransferase [Simplicispira psychrophila]|uniref:ArnT family glycosyltransferase n=1 Tax=Simplicispira psychrophila TaxID=80882 RepID=UPI000A03EAD9|nr:glycosyltransferase family 39 protein [Simplicispira psychrophila]